MSSDLFQGEFVVVLRLKHTRARNIAKSARNEITSLSRVPSLIQSC